MVTPVIPRVRPAVHKMDIEGDKEREHLACLEAGGHKERKQNRTVEREQNRIGLREAERVGVSREGGERERSAGLQFFCLMSYFTCFLK